MGKGRGYGRVAGSHGYQRLSSTLCGGAISNEPPEGVIILMTEDAEYFLVTEDGEGYIVL